MRPRGAYVMGRNMFGPIRGEWDKDWDGWWGSEPRYHWPVFVLTHHARESIEMEGGTSFHFVTQRFEAAYAQARETAGEDGIDIARISRFLEGVGGNHRNYGEHVRRSAGAATGEGLVRPTKRRDDAVRAARSPVARPAFKIRSGSGTHHRVYT